MLSYNMQEKIIEGLLLSGGETARRRSLFYHCDVKIGMEVSGRTMEIGDQNYVLMIWVLVHHVIECNWKINRPKLKFSDQTLI